ncbi:MULTISPECIES: MFS transporter [Psychrobacter]|uniref:MFS transporter n=1 Tax=Psychrobacter TaxID=497 RepID=UPI00146D3120|nr:MULTISPECIES: MFS transporter [Psychrobacter]
MMIKNSNKYLAFALCVITTSVNVQGPLYALYAQNDGYGVLATTIAFSFYVLGVIPVLLAFGGLSDRIGRRKTILIALGLSIAATALMMFYPYTRALAAARFMLGVGTALMAATATAYMIELIGASNTARATTWVTASTTVGFGLGPVLTTVSLLVHESPQPASFYFLLVSASLSIFLVWQLPETAPKRDTFGTMLKLPYFNRDVLWFGGAILICWATTGLVLSVIPSVLAAYGLGKYAGISSMLAISCGLLFQPIARKLDPKVSTKIAILILLPSYALLTWGALNANLPAILLAAFLASSSCYGFVYLGGLSGVARSAGNEQARASAGYFLMAYLGFSVPVIITGLIVDRYGTALAFYAFGLFLLLGALILFGSQFNLAMNRNSHFDV